MPTDPPDFHWLIEARAAIQTRLSELSALDRQHRAVLLEGDQSLARAYSILAAAGFSLWRAAFLSEVTHGWSEALDAARELIEEVLATNTAAFPTERKNKNWMFGYYLSNAMSRVTVARTLLGGTRGASADFDELLACGLFGTSKKAPEQWRIVYSAFSDVLDDLARRTFKA